MGRLRLGQLPRPSVEPPAEGPVDDRNSDTTDDRNDGEECSLTDVFSDVEQGFIAHGALKCRCGSEEN
jgi:hypothetical protein